jgi:hypothetical protein
MKTIKGTTEDNTMRKAYSSPPTPVWNYGRRKAKCTIAISNIKSLMADSSDDDLKEALALMESYQKKLLTL